MVKKRKMPAHIVLPNGMWRFVKGKASTAVKSVVKKSRSRRISRKRTGVVRMARRRRSSRRSSGGFGGSKLTKGLFQPKGIIASILVGAGAAHFQEKVLPQMHPLQGTAVGFAVGGIGGAAGAYATTMLNSGKVGTGSGTTGY